MTLADIQTRVWERLGEDTATTTAAESNKRYPATLVLSFLKEAVYQWSIAVGRDVGSTQLTLVADQLEYTLTTQPVRIISVMDDTNSIPLKPVHWKTLYDTEGFGRNRAWRDVQSNRPTCYTLFSFDKIWIWPTLASVTSETVTVRYLQETTDDLTSGTGEVPTVPKEYHHLLVDYVVGRCLMIGSTGPRVWT